MIVLDRKQQITIIVIAAIILFAAGHRVAGWYKSQNSSTPETVIKDNYGSSREIAVHVSGAVERPGVYKFAREARVSDALDKAVPQSDADILGLNLARLLKDGEKIEVPGKVVDQKESVNNGAVTPRKPVAAAARARVNINRAGAGELESLPGLGPALAERVINYRKDKGLFTSEEELKNVSGIGEKKYQKIKDLISVN